MCQLIVIGKAGSGQMQAIVDVVTARCRAASEFSCDLDLHIMKMAKLKNPIVMS